MKLSLKKKEKEATDQIVGKIENIISWRKIMRKIVSWKNKTAKTQHLASLINDSKKEPVDYSVEQNHNVGDYIKHSKFGVGFIQKIINHTKIEVFFENSEKVMLQNWQKG